MKQLGKYLLNDFAKKAIGIIKTILRKESGSPEKTFILSATTRNAEQCKSK